MAVFGVVAATLLGLGGCGTDEAEDATATTQTPAPFIVTVKIRDLAFDPRHVEVAVGGSVIWANDDITQHLIVSTTPNVIDSPLIGKAGSYTRSFATPGKYRYYCNIHNSMKGEVIVR